MKDGERGDVGHGEEGGAGDGKEPQGLQHTIEASGFLSTKTAQCSHVMSASGVGRSTMGGIICEQLL